MADSTAFTPWAGCTDKQQAYFDAFGADAQEPVGYTTVPMAMWLLTYDDGGTVETYAVNVAAVPGDCSVTTNIQPGADGKYEVAFVTDVGQLKDKSFNQGTWDGVKLFAYQNGLSYKYYQPANGDQATDDDRFDAMKQACDNGAKVIVGPGFMQADPCHCRGQSDGTSCTRACGRLYL